MKKKDIITIIICLVIFGGAGYFALDMLGVIGKSQSGPTVQTEGEVQEYEFTGEIDQETLEKVDKLNDYGEATLDNVGRANPFGPL